MRTLHKKEQAQRGCIYCIDVVSVGETWTSRSCPHDECPFHELDSVKSYAEYLNSVSDVPINTLLRLLCKK